MEIFKTVELFKTGARIITDKNTYIEFGKPENSSVAEFKFSFHTLGHEGVQKYEDINFMYEHWKHLLQVLNVGGLWKLLLVDKETSTSTGEPSLKSPKSSVFYFFEKNIVNNLEDVSLLLKIAKDKELRNLETTGEPLYERLKKGKYVSVAALDSKEKEATKPELIEDFDLLLQSKNKTEVLIWLRYGESSFGHVALRFWVDDQERYYSFWPNKKRKRIVEGIDSFEGVWQTYEEDVKKEEREEDYSFYFYCLDIGEMKKHFPFPLKTQTWKLTGLNCTTAVMEILKSGGIENYLSSERKFQIKKGSQKSSEELILHKRLRPTYLVFHSLLSPLSMADYKMKQLKCAELKEDYRLKIFPIGSTRWDTKTGKPTDTKVPLSEENMIFKK